MHRRLRLFASLLLALASVLLLGCGGSDSPDAADQAAEPVKIGTVFPMTGDLAKTGQLSVNGAKMAVEEINAAGGIKSMGGAKLELDIANTQGKPEVGMAEAERLISQDNVAVLIGTSMSSLALPISQKTERLKTPFIVCDAVANELTERGYQYTFRLIPKAEQFAQFQVDFVRDVPAINPDFGTIERVATIHEDSDYGVGIAADQVAYLKEQGFTHTVDVSYPYNATDLTTQLNKIKVTDPDAVIVASYLTDAIVLAQARERLEMMDIPFVDGGGGVLDPNFPKTLGDTAEYWFSATDYLPNASDEAEALAAKYRDMFGSEYTSNGNWGYQSIYVIAKALENAGSADRDALRQAIADVKLDKSAGDVVAIPTNTLEFDAEGQLANVALYIGQVLGGELQAVYPEELATETPLPPK